MMLIVGAVVQAKTLYASDKQLIIHANNAAFTRFTYRVMQGKTKKTYHDEASVVREHPHLFTQTLYEAQRITKQTAESNQKLFKENQVANAHMILALGDVKQAQEEIKEALRVNPTLQQKLKYYEDLLNKGLRLCDLTLIATAFYMTYQVYKTQGSDIVGHIFTNS